MDNPSPDLDIRGDFEGCYEVTALSVHILFLCLELCQIYLCTYLHRPCNHFDQAPGQKLACQSLTGRDCTHTLQVKSFQQGQTRLHSSLTYQTQRNLH